MSRTSRVRAIALFALLAAAGCQDYNFNPVGHCVIQPGTKRVTVSQISTADVLFVVDDSGSMGGEQQKLADNFGAFVGNLDATNVKRVANGLRPIDFHLAVTTSSVFLNEPAGAVCRSDCPNSGADGAVCCTMSGATPTGPLRAVEKCDGPGDACQVGTCRDDCRSYLGEFVCCGADRVPASTQEIACESVGEPCGNLRTHYRFSSSCTQGSAAGQDERPYPQGSFVSAGTNPRVIHFDKELYECETPPCTVNRQNFTSAQLQTFFKQNVVVGTCGSGQEQALGAATRALTKITSGEQYETVDANGNAAAPNTPAKWLHEGSKLVLVFVGDEDDCSSEEDPSRGIVLTGNPGADACVVDAAKPPEQQKQFQVRNMVSQIKQLAGDRPLGAAFIVSARAGGQDVCQDATCVPDICCDTACTGNGTCTSNVCGGQAKGSRLLEAAGQLRGAGADVVAGSVCDPNFGQILDRIAEIVKPPTGLQLPSVPAAEDIAIVRIARQDGTTRKTCVGPAPAEMTFDQARLAGFDWWFTATREQLPPTNPGDPDPRDPVAATQFIYLNSETNNCIADGDRREAYSADYLGRMPSSGCRGATAEEADASCVAALGGRPGDWTCYAGTDADDRCVIPTGEVVNGRELIGTCICGQRYTPPSAAGSPGGGNCSRGCSPDQGDYCPAVPAPVEPEP